MFTFTGQNQVDHAAMLGQVAVDKDVKDEIENALANGLEVSIHERPIADNGFIGSGYTIIDPNTGAGAWKVSGGASGGFVVYILSIIILMVLATIQFLAIFAGLASIAVLAGLVGLVAGGLIVYANNLDTLIIATARLTGVLALTVGIGNLMGASQLLELSPQSWGL